MAARDNHAWGNFLTTRRQECKLKFIFFLFWTGFYFVPFAQPSSMLIPSKNPHIFLGASDIENANIHHHKHIIYIFCVLILCSCSWILFFCFLSILNMYIQIYIHRSEHILCYVDCECSISWAVRITNNKCEWTGI